MTRAPVPPTPRKKITRHQRAVVFARQNGRCDGCGCKLFRPYIVDHVIQLWMGGADDVSNMHALCRACDAPKTAGDATARAKVKRLIRDADPETRKTSKRPIRSRGFGDKARPLTHPKLKRGFDGVVRPREQGR